MLMIQGIMFLCLALSLLTVILDVENILHIQRILYNFACHYGEREVVKEDNKYVTMKLCFMIAT